MQKKKKWGDDSVQAAAGALIYQREVLLSSTRSSILDKLDGGVAQVLEDERSLSASMFLHYQTQSSFLLLHSYSTTLERKRSSLLEVTTKRTRSVYVLTCLGSTSWCQKFKDDPKAVACTKNACSLISSSLSQGRTTFRLCRTTMWGSSTVNSQTHQQWSCNSCCAEKY